MKKTKRIFAVFTALALTACTFTPLNTKSASLSERKLGDTTGSDNVIISDVTAIQRELALLEKLDEVSKKAADVNGDKKITIDDATEIQRWIAGFTVPYQINKPMNLYSSEKQKAAAALKTRYTNARSGLSASDPVLMRAYDTSKIELSNSAYVYDNALAAMVFISEGEKTCARQILDAFVYASEHDRYKNGRLRNAYAAGNLHYIYQGREIAALPGWWDSSKNQWCEDPTQTGSYVGNTAYAALAMLQYDAAYNESRYLNTVKTIMDWVIGDCSDSSDGFTGGYEGWPEEENGEVKLKYKSLEHNLDAYCVFNRLYSLTNEAKYKNAADSALRFIRSMYDETNRRFFTGTNKDGSINRSVVVLDAQVWSALVLDEAFEPYKDALDTAEQMKQPGGGYSFCLENKNGGWWAEGTAFTALTCRSRGDDSKYIIAMDALCSIQPGSGMFPAATVNNHHTGIKLTNGEDWLYNTDPHVASTAWFVLAVNNMNPYAFK